MSFQVPLSSSPLAPSTPGSEKRHPNPFARSMASNPSTTPAGPPPPSSAGSFTPAGPPPSSIFGSSQLGSGKSLFKGKPKAATKRSTMDSSKVSRFLDQDSNFNFSNGNGSVTRNTFALPDSSPMSRDSVQHDLGEEDEEDVEEYSEEEGSESYSAPAGLIGRTIDASQSAGHAPLSFGSYLNGRPVNPAARAPPSPLAASTLGGTPRNVKRSRGGSAMVSVASPRVRRSSRKAGKDPNAPSIAQDMSKRLGIAPLEEPDDLIIGTEESVSSLFTAISGANEDSEALASALSSTGETLCNLWNTCCKRDARKASWREEVVVGIGPGDSAPGAHSATFLGTLLLPLYHPAAAKGGQAFAMSRLNRSTQSLMVPYSLDAPLNPTAYPQILLDWLDKNHNPYHAMVSEVQTHKPNPSAHDFYWDIIYKLAIRGKFAELLGLMKRADFRHARTAKDDGHKEAGYRGVQLENINMVIGWAVQAIQACPALTDDDWHVPANPWIIFRKHIEKAMDNLINFAEGRDKDLDPEEPSFEASNFGLMSTTNHLSRSSRRAESRVPWTILQNLKTLYGILLGGSLEILSNSENWVEGTVALTAWWGGEDDEEVAVSSLAMSRRSHRQSRSRDLRLVDTDPGLAYRRRMALAFDRLADEPEASDSQPMLPDTSKPLEVALSSIFEGDIEGAIGILRAMSLPIADAIAEIGTIGGWLQPPSRDIIMEGFDEEDMDLLSFERSVLPADEPIITRSAIMKEYAESLFNRSELIGQRGVIVDGWELSIAVLARLGVNYNTSSKKEIRKVLKRLPLDSDAQIDKILHICRNYDMPEEGRNIVEQYADSVLDSSDDYGTALIYYARAYSRKKIKGVLDLLISYSLVQSTAYPAPAALDRNLHALIFAPKESLEHLSLLDDESAAILHEALTGYATLRKFYDLRDGEVSSSERQDLSQGPRTGKIKAAAALLAVINSAADNIHGSLYDEARGSIVHVDGLLALLGEAMVFVNQTPSLLTLPQSFSLLQAIEDLSTVTPRIYAQSEEFFRSTLAAHARGNIRLPSPRQMLKKQMSSMTTGSSFSLVGSSLLDSGLVDAMDVDSGSSSQALTASRDDERRGWDWRAGLDENASGEDVLRILRLGLAREIARWWMKG